MRIVDIHIHGIGGFDTRTTDENHILKVAEIIGSQGVSEIIPTIYPSTIKVMREHMMTVRKAIEQQQSVVSNQSHTHLPSPRGGRVREGVKAPNLKLTRIIGIHLEGPFLNPIRCGALDATSFMEPTEKSFRQLIEGFEDIVKIVTVAPELKGALKLIKKISDRGIIASMGHSDAIFSEAEAGFHAGAKGITHIFNAMRRFHHREMGIAGFGLLNKDIYIEVIADPFHLHPETLALIFKIKNPQKIIIVSDAVKETTSPVPFLSSVTHARQPLTKGLKGKNRGISDTKGNLLGGSITLLGSAERLVNSGFDKEIIMNCITKNPAEYLSV